MKLGFDMIDLHYEPNLTALTHLIVNQPYSICLLPGIQGDGFLESSSAFCVFGGKIHTHTHTYRNTTFLESHGNQGFKDCGPNLHALEFPGILDKMQILGPRPTSIE